MSKGSPIRTLRIAPLTWYAIRDEIDELNKENPNNKLTFSAFILHAALMEVERNRQRRLVSNTPTKSTPRKKSKKKV